ncbi:MAG: hypothetical protein ACREAM_17040, partial [Blastocatellia bacterium]
RRAPTPYDEVENPVGYRQLASQAIGSEICTVPDFARFLAAAVSGPGSEAPGRGVLRQQSISTMLEVQPNARNAGLGYGIASSGGEKILTHSGGNPGWSAFFRLSADRREGFVIANNSSRGGRVNQAIGKLWSEACRGRDTGREQR